MKMKIKLLSFLFLSSIIISSCVKENIINQPSTLIINNPYDSLDYNNNVIPPIPIDSNSFLGIHSYILATKCAQPACHDGAFEPDYRTVQSAYSTLVYAPVFKNSADSIFTYRVVPYDTTFSWLHERITTDDAVLGRMPLYDTLSKKQINRIEKWIMNGAPDIFGNIPNLPNSQPAFFGLVAYLTSNNYRVDTVRGNSSVNPFMVPSNQEVDIWFGVYDDITLPPLMGVRKIKLSTDPANFSSVVSNDLLTESVPFYAPAFNTGPAPYFLHYKVNTSNYNSGDIVYMRIYVQDSDHAFATEIPSGSSQYYYQSYFSFVVQ
jgi:hypothetical protein